MGSPKSVVGPLDIFLKTNCPFLEGLSICLCVLCIYMIFLM